ncbi:MAG: hypothetical protein Q8861_01905 [Bacteroidota bacterium]|nr:hypothetical protein [Bacteroidota bacterium]
MNRAQLITYLKSVIYPNSSNAVDAGKHQALEEQIINDMVIKEELPYMLVSAPTLTADTIIPIPAGTYISEINVIFLTGNPTVNIPEADTGDLTGLKWYPIPANLSYTEAGNLTVNMTGEGSIKVQIVKLNI